MIKFLFVIAGLASAACNQSVSQTATAPFSVNKNKTAVTPSPIVSPTPTSTTQNVAECARDKIYGLPKEITVSQQLCVDDTKPIDKGERVNVPSGNNAAYSQILETDTPFEKLPKEVRQIILLTAPKIDTNSIVFSLTVVPVNDPRANDKFVKSYVYNSINKDSKNKDNSNLHSWIFKRQNKVLKLDSAEIETPK